MIDVGKSFQQAAVEWFPKYGLRKIDAVLITHAHADGMSGFLYAPCSFAGALMNTYPAFGFCLKP